MQRCSLAGIMPPLQQVAIVMQAVRKATCAIRCQAITQLASQTMQAAGSVAEGGLLPPK